MRTQIIGSSKRKMSDHHILAFHLRSITKPTRVLNLYIEALLLLSQTNVLYGEHFLQSENHA